MKSGVLLGRMCPEDCNKKKIYDKSHLKVDIIPILYQLSLKVN